ncbi:hypothetical protein [Novosphingobium sp. Gsoil 351]|uniref:hypothetical protein n=1 Tax=Novosphingobium sp. Gsoil 351 TaxID=2675225 RepID=UPI0018A82CFB|nr:hypothetical protein [Novosphingobium sp. Gsoil 351]
MTNSRLFVPGLRAPAIFFAAAVVAAIPVSALAQAAQPGRPAVSSQPVPSELELAKLVWSTMAMVDHANRSGNYSVLRDSSASGFQIQNDPARLAEIFAPIRALRVDLSNALIVAPTYTGGPTLLQPDVFRVQGYFPLRPSPIFFDFYFQWEQGRWKLFGISVQPGSMSQPAPPQPQPAPTSSPPKRRNR